MDVLEIQFYAWNIHLVSYSLDTGFLNDHLDILKKNLFDVWNFFQIMFL